MITPRATPPPIPRKTYNHVKSEKFQSIIAKYKFYNALFVCSEFGGVEVKNDESDVDAVILEPKVKFSDDRADRVARGCDRCSDNKIALRERKDVYHCSALMF